RFIKHVNVVDLALVGASIAITGYIFLNFETVIYRVNNPNALDFTFGVIAIGTVLEAGRRTIGWHLPAIGIAAIAYAYFADFMPGPFRGPPKDLDYIVSNQYLGLDGMLGTPLQVVATFIILFTIYGAILDYTGVLPHGGDPRHQLPAGRGHGQDADDPLLPRHPADDRDRRPPARCARHRTRRAGLLGAHEAILVPVHVAVRDHRLPRRGLLHD